MKAGLCAFAFIVLALAILSRPEWKLTDFDQIFYVTIAYDMERDGVFSNGIFGAPDDAASRAQPGMFFGPVFPAIVYAAMRVDRHFAETVRCTVESDRGVRTNSACDAYALPIRLLNAFFLAIGVVAVASAAELIFGRRRALFLLSGALATAALAAEAEIFSYVMTESVLFALYSIVALALLRAWKTRRGRDFAMAGVALGLLCLTKLAFLILLPFAAAITLYYGFRIAPKPGTSGYGHALIFTGAVACVVLPWAIRNELSVGKFGLTEEYGSATLIERFAYDDMTAQEFLLAFPYCTPEIGDLLFDRVYGDDAMHRFVFHTAGSFFHVGRDQRDSLVQAHGKLDPLIGDIIRQEMAGKWWRYVLVSIPLAWCGMWPGGVVTLLLLPLFAWSLLRAGRREPLLLLYTAPAVLMLGLHAALGNHYTRYNLILIGPYAVGAAWLILSILPCAHWRARFRAPVP